MNWKKLASIGLIRTMTVGDHHVRVYADRLAVWRRDGWPLTWDELQRVKCAVWGTRTAIEVYPPPNEVVNFKNTRHLWWTPELDTLVTQVCRHPEFDEVIDGRKQSG